MFFKRHNALATATDRYDGRIGQIYNKEYEISKRNKKVGNKTFTEEILPIESVVEYFQHFSVLEVDFTFYRPLLNKDLEPTSSYRILQSYQKHLKNDDQLILKIPQVIIAKRHRAFPFDKMVDGMLQPGMISETVAMMKTAIDKGINMSVIVNNRAGGNAPLIAHGLVDQFIRWMFTHI